MNHPSIPNDLRNLDFAALALRIESTGDQAGRDLVIAQRERLGKSGCAACARRAASATLRAWLTRHMEKDGTK